MDMASHAQSDVLTSRPVVISESWFDIDNDGQKEKIEIILERGERYDDREEWCGNGEKWEGYFTIQVRKGNVVLSKQSLNDLALSDEKDPEPLSFWTPEFSLVFKDYNMDGQIDFNLGQYGSCNGNYFRLFTVNPDGIVSPLRIKGAGGFFVSPPNRHNSTDLISIEKGFLVFTYYDNTSGKNVTVRYRWDKKQFVPIRKTSK
ncbi:MAG: hypothetical protein NT178_04970 [Proteobacteria bacterium]|nr:hypothetical protein [Pseudomonadota bacterium]